MTLRHVDLALRHKLLLAIPILLGILAGAAWTMLTLKDTYLSVATVWVERPTTETSRSFIDFDQWISPAQNQVNSMRELLATRSFRGDVLERANGQASSPFDLVAPHQLTQNTYITAIGTHAVSIGHQSSSPATAHTVVDAVLGAYTELYSTQITERAQSSKQFFEEQLKFAGSNLEEAHSQLNAYLLANPIVREEVEAPATPADITAAAATDLALARLIGAEEIARETYDRIFAQFADIQIAANSTASGNANFRVLDPPEVPVLPQERGKRDLMLKPLLGLVMGSFISGGLFILISRLDRHVWLPADLSSLGLSVPIMTLPHLQSPSRRWPRSFLRLATALRGGLGRRGGPYEIDGI